MRRVVYWTVLYCNPSNETAARVSILAWASKPNSQHGPRSRKVDALGSGRGRKSSYIGIEEVGCSERTGNLMDGDDKTATSLP